MLCLLSMTSCSSQSIYYEPIGYSDKPLPSIELKMTKDSIADYRNIKRVFSVNVKEFERITCFIARNDLAEKKDGSNSEFPYGAYQLTIETGKVYLLPNKEASLIFFENQLKFITDSRIRQEFELIITRLR